MDSLSGGPDRPVIFLSGYGRDETIARALELGVTDCGLDLYLADTRIDVDGPVLPPSSVATPRLNASVSWPACVGERHK